VPFRRHAGGHVISPPAATQVGEFWKDDMDTINKYLDSMGTQFSVFDAPLHYNFKQAGEAGSDFDLTKIFEGTVVQHRPIDAVTLVDNVRSCGTMQVQPADASYAMRAARHPSRAIPRIMGVVGIQAPRVLSDTASTCWLSVRDVHL
jgi:hypothetical protein